MLLWGLTLVAILAIVLVLAGYLIAIAWQLDRARRNVADLADGLEEVTRNTRPLDDRIGRINEALEAVLDGFGAVDENLEGAVGTFRR